MAEKPHLPTSVPTSLPTSLPIGGDAAADSGPDAILAVVDGVLPALISRLAASELGELEIAQDGWRVRLRRDSGANRGHGTPLGAGGYLIEGTAPADGLRNTIQRNVGGHSSSSSGSGSGSASGSGSRSSVVRRAALAPAVGYFTPRDGLATGQAVRAGDVLGTIDVLGVTQPVVAPADGVVGRILASLGEAVEFGQELVRIDGIERLVES